MPPPALYEAEPTPSVPDGVPKDERTAYLLDAYAARGDALDRARKRDEAVADWVKMIQKLYPRTETVELQPVD